MKEKYMNDFRFYPTSLKLIEKISKKENFLKYKKALEPSAGSGNIVSFLLKEGVADVDCFEIDPYLQNKLAEKGFNLVGEDFLKSSLNAEYDLIFMNPPFNVAELHLEKALRLLKNTRGKLIAIVSHETIRGGYKNCRKINKLLKKNRAEISFMQNEFVESDNSTDIEIAVIKIEAVKFA